MKHGGTDDEMPEIIGYNVCLSPGCISDGAQATLERLQALAPPNVRVQEGGCISACGNGPVVTESSLADQKLSKVHRRVKGTKARDLLLEASNLRDDGDREASIFTATPANVIEGYDLVIQADAEFEKKNYKEAARLYEEAIALSFAPALELQRLREKLQPKESSSTQTRLPVELEWLVRARRNEAQCLLDLGKTEDAILAAQSACNISRNTSFEAFQLLAEIYRSKDDAKRELQALQTMFALPVEEDKLSMQQKNQRRVLGFRLASLERQVAS